MWFLTNFELCHSKTCSYKKIRYTAATFWSKINFRAIYFKVKGIGKWLDMKLKGSVCVRC